MMAMKTRPGPTKRQESHCPLAKSRNIPYLGRPKENLKWVAFLYRT
ncbi:hypothetical protein FHT17_003245 [Novosphingobium sp. SG916]|nr:hypothetical protein [Novosphingobium sp. SG919]NMN88338.1 hypothetical protein [Novosphingobium sp. SG916]